jgi:hypothetical protein
MFKHVFIEVELRIAFLNLDNVSRLRPERLRLFHSLTVAGTKKSLAKESLISKTVAHTLIYSILFPQQSKVRLSIPFEMATILLFHSVDFLDNSSCLQR